MSPELAFTIMYMCPSTPSPGNTVDTIFLKHWSVRGHPWLWDSTLTILALKLASLLSGRRWQVRHDTIMTTLYLCSMLRQNVFIPSLNSYQHHTFKFYRLTQLSRQLLQWGVKGSLNISCLNTLKLTTVIIYIDRNGNFKRAMMNRESCYNLKLSTLSLTPLEPACSTTWRSATPPSPGDTAAAPSLAPSPAPGHL